MKSTDLFLTNSEGVHIPISEVMFLTKTNIHLKNGTLVQYSSETSYESVLAKLTEYQKLVLKYSQLNISDHIASITKDDLASYTSNLNSIVANFEATADTLKDKLAKLDTNQINAIILKANDINALKTELKDIISELKQLFK